MISFDPVDLFVFDLKAMYLLLVFGFVLFYNLSYLVKLLLQ